VAQNPTFVIRDDGGHHLENTQTGVSLPMTDVHLYIGHTRELRHLLEIQDAGGIYLGCCFSGIRSLMKVWFTHKYCHKAVRPKSHFS